MSSSKSNLDNDRRLLLGLPTNNFHPLVYIGGEPEIGADVYIGLFSEINAVGARVQIGSGCDIASFVSINVADSHLRCVELSQDVQRSDIILGSNVFVGSHAVILGGCTIGHHSVVAAGSVLSKMNAPPGSLIQGNPAVCIPGKYLDKDDAVVRLQGHGGVTSLQGPQSDPA